MPTVPSELQVFTLFEPEQFSLFGSFDFQDVAIILELGDVESIPTHPPVGGNIIVGCYDTVECFVISIALPHACIIAIIAGGTLPTQCLDMIAALMEPHRPLTSNSCAIVTPTSHYEVKHDGMLFDISTRLGTPWASARSPSPRNRFRKPNGTNPGVRAVAVAF